jgi:lipoprotein-anchoring transpeptidase ErfK/SrfK
MRPTLRMLLAVSVSLIASVLVMPVVGADAKGSACLAVPGASALGGPTNNAAWRAGLEQRTAVYYRLPGAKPRASGWVGPGDAPWLLVLGRARAAGGRCWARLRLPWRPNAAAGWVNANHVLLQRTPWRIDVSRIRRTLTVFHAGVTVRTVRAVVGKPTTPTPAGLFAVAWAVPWHPSDFLGSWVLLLTAHSDVLRQFDGGDGTVGIHGRGGASLADPLGSARSHGCIRLSNDSIDWLVRTIGRDRLPGTPIAVS